MIRWPAAPLRIEHQLKAAKAIGLTIPDSFVLLCRE
jgi:hypothetical protein